MLHAVFARQLTNSIDKRSLISFFGGLPINTQFLNLDSLLQNERLPSLLRDPRCLSSLVKHVDKNTLVAVLNDIIRINPDDDSTILWLAVAMIKSESIHNHHGMLESLASPHLKNIFIHFLKREKILGKVKWNNPTESVQPASILSGYYRSCRAPFPLHTQIDDLILRNVPSLNLSDAIALALTLLKSSSRLPQHLVSHISNHVMSEPHNLRARDLHNLITIIAHPSNPFDEQSSQKPSFYLIKSRDAQSFSNNLDTDNIDQEHTFLEIFVNELVFRVNLMTTAFEDSLQKKSKHTNNSNHQSHAKSGNINLNIPESKSFPHDDLREFFPDLNHISTIWKTISSKGLISFQSPAVVALHKLLLARVTHMQEFPQHPINLTPYNIIDNPKLINNKLEANDTLAPSSTRYVKDVFNQPFDIIMSESSLANKIDQSGEASTSDWSDGFLNVNMQLLELTSHSTQNYIAKTNRDLSSTSVEMKETEIQEEENNRTDFRHSEDPFSSDINELADLVLIQPRTALSFLDALAAFSVNSSSSSGSALVDGRNFLPKAAFLPSYSVLLDRAAIGCQLSLETDLHGSQEYAEKMDTDQAYLSIQSHASLLSSLECWGIYDARIVSSLAQRLIFSSQQHAQFLRQKKKKKKAANDVASDCVISNYESWVYALSSSAPIVTAPFNYLNTESYKGIEPPINNIWGNEKVALNVIKMILKSAHPTTMHAGFTVNEISKLSTIGMQIASHLALRGENCWLARIQPVVTVQDEQKHIYNLKNGIDNSIQGVYGTIHGNSNRPSTDFNSDTPTRYFFNELTVREVDELQGVIQSILEEVDSIVFPSSATLDTAASSSSKNAQEEIANAKSQQRIRGKWPPTARTAKRPAVRVESPGLYRRNLLKSKLGSDALILFSEIVAQALLRAYFLPSPSMELKEVLEQKLNDGVASSTAQKAKFLKDLKVMSLRETKWLLIALRIAGSLGHMPGNGSFGGTGNGAFIMPEGAHGKAAANVLGDSVAFFSDCSVYGIEIGHCAYKHSKTASTKKKK